MAERRMFTQKIIDSDAFLDMPMSTQALYFHLNMRADDDGFINNPKKVCRMIGASEDDIKLLIAKRFVLAFESGVIVIKHWRMHNLIRKDRYHGTQYQEEMSRLSLKENGAYTDNGNQLATSWQPNGNQLATEVSIGKDSIVKNNIYSSNHSSNQSSNEPDFEPNPEPDEPKPDIKSEFDELWKLYPRKQGKQKAYEAYRKARKKGTTYQQVMDGIEAYNKHCQQEKVDQKYVKMGSTFFNQQCWLDEYQTVAVDDDLEGIL